MKAIDRARYYIGRLDVPEAIEVISRYRKSLRPRELDESIFPKGLHVLHFVPGEIIKIGIKKPWSERSVTALISLFQYLIFSSIIFGGVILSPFIGNLGFTLGLILGLVLWGWRNWLGTYASIDLVKRTYAIVEPASRREFNDCPEIELHSTRDGGVWTTTLSISGALVAKRHSLWQSEASDLKYFADSLKGALGGKFEIGCGVFVAP